MSILAKILSSQVRAELFRLLFDQNKASLHLRELQRKSKMAIGTIQQEIKTLKELDLVFSRKDGNRLYYSANSSHPIYMEICQLVAKTNGVVENLRTLLSKVDAIQCAFIFGSFATQTEKARSDIDLIIVGEIGLRQLSPTLKLISEKIEREINPHVYSKKIWKDKLKKKDHFIRSVLSEKKIFLVGDGDVLK